MTGRVTVKKGYWHLVISYKDCDGEFKQHWKKTDLKERGNKKEAEKQLTEEIARFALELKEEERRQQSLKRLSTKQDAEKARQMPFEDYVSFYVEEIAPTLSVTALTEYRSRVKVIKDYFAPLKIKLYNVTANDVIAFNEYLRKERKLKEITVKHYANIIRPALKMAYQRRIIPENPFDFVPVIHKEKHQPSFYNKEEMEAFFNAIAGHEMELEFKMLAYYGLRRSELLGLKWDAIDYDNGIIYVKRTLVCPKKNVIVSERMKTKTSNRTLPLIPEIRDMLKARETRIRKDKDYFGKGYKTEYDGFVCVNAEGGIILPDHLTKTFEKLLKKNDLKHIRLHDLRHSCASLMLANGVQMKQIQEWLGHANYSTTADVYSHLDFTSKLQSAETIAGVLQFGEKKEPSKEELEQEIKRLQKKLANM